MKFLLFLPFLLTLLACSNKQASPKAPNPTLAQPQHAEFFHFEMNKDGETELVVNDADTGKEIFRSKALNHPNTIVLSTTHIGMLNALNQLQLIIGTPPAKYIHNSVITEKEKSLIQIQNESELPLEQIYFAKTQLLIHSAYTPELAQHKLLTDKNIVSFPNQDWKELTPLARAEWIKAIGFLIGEEKEATEQFTKIAENYHSLKEQVANLPLSEQTICGNIFGEYWNTPAKDSYAAQLLKDAKIDYRYKDIAGKTTLSLTLEQVLSDNQASKLWINPGVSTKKELLQSNPRAYLIPAFELNTIYGFSHDNNYFWENSLVYPDRLLSDLIQIAHPNQSILKDSVYFYKKIK